MIKNIMLRTIIINTLLVLFAFLLISDLQHTSCQEEDHEESGPLQVHHQVNPLRSYAEIIAKRSRNHHSNNNRNIAANANGFQSLRLESLDTSANNPNIQARRVFRLRRPDGSVDDVGAGGLLASDSLSYQIGQAGVDRSGLRAVDQNQNQNQEAAQSHHLTSNQNNQFGYTAVPSSDRDMFGLSNQWPVITLSSANTGQSSGQGYQLVGYNQYGQPISRQPLQPAPQQQSQPSSSISHPDGVHNQFRYSIGTNNQPQSPAQSFQPSSGHRFAEDPIANGYQPGSQLSPPQNQPSYESSIESGPLEEDYVDSPATSPYSSEAPPHAASIPRHSVTSSDQRGHNRGISRSISIPRNVIVNLRQPSVYLKDQRVHSRERENQQSNFPPNFYKIDNHKQPETSPIEESQGDPTGRERSRDQSSFYNHNNNPYSSPQPQSNLNVNPNYYETRQTERPIETHTERPVEHPIERPIERPVERPIERPRERARERQNIRPIERQVERSRPVERVIERPAARPAPVIERQLVRTVERTLKERPVPIGSQRFTQSPRESVRDQVHSLRQPDPTRRPIANRNRGRERPPNRQRIPSESNADEESSHHRSSQDNPSNSYSNSNNERERDYSDGDYNNANANPNPNPNSYSNPSSTESTLSSPTSSASHSQYRHNRNNHQVLSQAQPKRQLVTQTSPQPLSSPITSTERTTSSSTTTTEPTVRFRPRPAGRPGGNRGFTGRGKRKFITSSTEQPRLTTSTQPPSNAPNDYDYDEYEDDYDDYYEDPTTTTSTTQAPQHRRRFRGGRREGRRGGRRGGRGGRGRGRRREYEEPSSTTVTTEPTTTTTLSPNYKHRKDGRIIDYHADPNFPYELRGADLTEYPFFIRVPPGESIDFKCDGRHDGYYANIQLKCQIYHHCATGHQRYDFICPNYTLFDQQTFTCRFMNTVECQESENHYIKNNELYVKDSIFSSNSKQNKTANTTSVEPILIGPVNPRPKRNTQEEDNANFESKMVKHIWEDKHSLNHTDLTSSPSNLDIILSGTKKDKDKEKYLQAFNYLLNSTNYDTYD